MSDTYDYQIERKILFTEEGQVLFLKIQNRAQYFLGIAGAFRAENVMRGVNNDNSWTALACIDRLVELKEIIECSNFTSRAAQHRIYTDYTRLQ